MVQATLLMLCLWPASGVWGQQLYTQQDSLRGSLNPMRTCYDVTHYDLNLRIEPERKFIGGYNRISFKALADCQALQLDLFDNMQLDSILWAGKSVPFERDGHVVIVRFPTILKKDSPHILMVYYKGQPKEARNAPWDGGFVWQKDQNNRPWVGIACEGIGASLWYPCKDHLSDEPDSARMAFEVPMGLYCVSNGRLIGQKVLDSAYTRYVWAVNYPINNYNITLNIGAYSHLADTYTSTTDGEKLALDYYVLDYNASKAAKHFEQVKPMLGCYEKLFGKYPFWRDGYALVETPYWGMEHQGAIAYGNNYRNNAFGFDFIIVHESGHEYWGNSISVADHAEMWIHESFCTYTEALYVECLQGYAAAVAYLQTQRKHIRNKQAVLGPLGVNYDGWEDADSYYKGTWMLHTLRSVLQNDTLWFRTLYGLAQRFRLSTVSTPQIIAYINQSTGKDFTAFFDQYLRYAQAPMLVYKWVQNNGKTSLHYRWQAQASGFDMPVKVLWPGQNTFTWLHPKADWQTLELTSTPSGKGKFDLKVDTDSFYVLTQAQK